jgi:hypothetical protein
LDQPRTTIVGKKDVTDNCTLSLKKKANWSYNTDFKTYVGRVCDVSGSWGDGKNNVIQT